jgi:hypothetical protein
MLVSIQNGCKAIESSFFGKILLENGVSTSFAGENFKILDDLSLKDFWLANFGNDGKKRRIPDGFWMFNPDEKVPICTWMDRTKKIDQDEVRKCLLSKCNWPTDRLMIFFGGVEVVITQWQHYATNWNSFVEFNDEGLLCCSSDSEGLIISPHGSFFRVAMSQAT